MLEHRAMGRDLVITREFGPRHKGSIPLRSNLALLFRFVHNKKPPRCGAEGAQCTSRALNYALLSSFVSIRAITATVFYMELLALYVLLYNNRSTHICGPPVSLRTRGAFYYHDATIMFQPTTKAATARTIMTAIKSLRRFSAIT